MSDTALDQAHQAMIKAPENDQLRLEFFGKLASAELFLFLETEASDDQVEPQIFETEDGSFVLAFDREDRLADFAGNAVPYAALSGRALVNLLNGSELGVLLNAGFPSSVAITPDALHWMWKTLSSPPEQNLGKIKEISAPRTSQRLLGALDGALANAVGLAKSAYLASATYEDGTNALLLAVLNAKPGAETSLANAIQEALMFSENQEPLDVVFISPDTPILGLLEKHGLRFDLPTTSAAQPPKPPGLDPNTPPKLR